MMIFCTLCRLRIMILSISWKIFFTFSPIKKKKNKILKKKEDWIQCAEQMCEYICVFTSFTLINIFIWVYILATQVCVCALVALLFQYNNDKITRTSSTSYYFSFHLANACLMFKCFDFLIIIKERLEKWVLSNPW